MLEPFLRQFQSPAPLAVFLYDCLGNLLRSLMMRFVKKDVMTSAKTTTRLFKIDVASKDIRCRYKDVDIGVAAVKALANCKASERDIMSFRMQCIEFLACATTKIMERSPLNFSLTRAISCLAPRSIQSSPDLCQQRMGTLLSVLFESGHITSSTADRAKLQFTTLCSLSGNSFKEKFKQFTYEDRLDSFYAALLQNDSDFADLWSVVKLVLTLSHGNASVEAGFSVNGDLLVENMLEESVVAQRQVYDGVLSLGGVTAVPITKSMIQFVRASRTRYEEHLAKKKQMKADSERKSAEMK
jgi:hypothetical protein